MADFGWLHGKSLRQGLEAVGRCSSGWDVAHAVLDGIMLHTLARNADYDRQALREFRLALEVSDILVDVGGRTLAPEFFREHWQFIVDGERLQYNHAEHVAPRLIVRQALEGQDRPGQKPGRDPAIPEFIVQRGEFHHTAAVQAARGEPLPHGWKEKIYGKVIDEVQKKFKVQYRTQTVGKILRDTAPAFAPAKQPRLRRKRQAPRKA